MSSAIVVDWGLYPELALRLARDIEKVFYFSPWASARPTPSDQLIASGLGEFDVERVDFPFELIDTPEEPDVWIFLDLYFSDWEGMLRRMGKNVWGSGWGQLLELDRWKLNDVLTKAGHDIAPTSTIEGIDKLNSHLRTTNDRYIKVAQYFRGITETFAHKGWPASRSWFDDLKARLGPTGDSMRFMSQESVEGDSVEPGIDMMIVNGQPLSPMLLGYEKKGSGILSKVIDKMPDWSSPAKDVISALSGEGSAYTNFFSFEARKTEDQVFILDATCRMPSPSDAVHIEIWENLTEVIMAGAKGQAIAPKPAGKYAAQIILSSPAIRTRPLHVAIPTEIRDNVKLWNFYRDKDGEYWCLPDKLGDPAFGGVVAVGDSLEEVQRRCLEYAEAVEAEGKDFQGNVFDDIKADIAKGRALGVEF